MNDRFTRRNDNKIEVLHDYTYTHKISKRFLRNIHHKWLKRTLNSCLMCREKYFFPSFDCDNMCDVSCVCGLWIYRWFILRFQSLNCLHKTLSNAVHFWFFFQLPATAIVVTVSSVATETIHFYCWVFSSTFSFYSFRGAVYFIWLHVNILKSL